MMYEPTQKSNVNVVQSYPTSETPIYNNLSWLSEAPIKCKISNGILEYNDPEMTIVMLHRLSLFMNGDYDCTLLFQIGLQDIVCVINDHIHIYENDIGRIRLPHNFERGLISGSIDLI